MTAKSAMSLADLASTVNEALEQYPDKDWNYSRISLELRPLDSIDSPYALWVEEIATNTKNGQQELKELAQEVGWGMRHSNELGIAELISLRLNRALMEVDNDKHWGHLRPVIRLVKREVLSQQGIDRAFWYHIREVSGEEFDNR